MELLEQSRISPPLGSVQDSSLPLSLFDVVWLDFSAVKRCFFYRFPHSTSHFIDSHLPNLKRSLSLALQHFYPLAGKIRLSPASDDQFEIHYADGDSIPFAVAEWDDDHFDDLVGSEPHDYTRLERLLPNSDSLLAIQLTVFPNNGIAVGFAIHHVGTDGLSYTHFIKHWAAVCRSEHFSNIQQPTFDRAGLAGLHDYYLLAVKMRRELKPDQDPAEKSQAEADSVCGIFTLGPDQIERLKQSVRAKADNAAHCSTFVVSSAYLWTCLVKLRQCAADQMVYFPIAADWRRRLQPPLPAMYFGNCVFFSFVEMKAGDIVKDDGLVAASEAIGRTIEGFKDGIVKVIEEGREIRARAFASRSLFTIGGSPRFGVYDADFGWGRPGKVEVCMKNGGVFMAESREKAGGVEIGLVLPRHEMEEFSSIFREGLENMFQFEQLQP